MRKVEHVMGLPISIDIPNCEDDDVFNVAFTRFHKIDEQFSPYKKNSEVSRVRDGKIEQTDLSLELKKIIKDCHKAEAMTDGYFSAWAAGTFDPSGYVKGWAIAEAGKLIEKKGFKTYCIGAGGDILARSQTEKIWEIGIQDPLNKYEILNKLSISNGAVATSGSYERGAHIIIPKTKQPADELLSVTVTGPDIIKADILATACFAMGPKATTFMKSQLNYQALIIS
jgi:thiamine biosynthesis lipoprotein